ncbi:transmembrane protein [Legionella moravica]|uniref:Transmembrane protein n=1 Tax=Legionella moravica TaxID=39962 RepID=A0A378K6T1_9GAMM|nr:DUF2165 domain-containing protein [Legionella moravica]KTD30964.1 transmembrane protein [Legionella moravica]STX63541.1 transmembrane protein [Legionella moravica]
MMIRLSKIVLVAAVSFYCLLTAFGNITDYASNLPAVEKALSMKDVFPGSKITYRAITTPELQHAAYIGIISMETLTTLLCALGAWKLFRARKKEASVFNQAKSMSVAGLTLGFLTWQVLFMSIGGEWFGMWMSPMLNNAITTAFHIFIMILSVLIYLVIKDE